MGLHWLDWTVLITTLICIVTYGIYKTRKASNDANNFLKGTEKIRWWAIGISVMATQASAITFMSTPGQAFSDGMGFVQVYFGLPIAMAIICLTFIPIFHKLNVITAYEYLENRFDNKTRQLTSMLFLIQRGLGTGLTISAPSIIFSAILGWDFTTLNIIIGSIVILYTISGGTRAVSVTQNYQMAIMLGGMVVAFFTTLYLLPHEITFGKALSVAGLGEKMNVVNFSFDPTSRYTFWSGITGGMFLALSYFGTDQSQVQRYISGNNIKESRLGLIFNGLLKVPMQFFILLCGIMVYVFFQFQPAPLFFNQKVLSEAKSSSYGVEINKLEIRYDSVFNARKEILYAADNNTTKGAEIATLNKVEAAIRKNVKEIIAKSNGGTEQNDKDYVFIYFVLNYLPIGVVGLLLAVVFCAAMSATSSGISALATCTTVDIYQRNFAKNATSNQSVKASRWFILLWGGISILFANLSGQFENLIQFVNIVGSIFYGVILGVFLAGFYFKELKSNHVFYAAIAVELLVIGIYLKDVVGYLWLNAIGCVGVILVAYLIKTLPFSFNKNTEATKRT
jgi:solute:Na+ symporter, SSS family